MSLTSKSYWDVMYDPLAPQKRSMIDPNRHYSADELMRFLAPHLPCATKERPVFFLEMGCGNSKWLPYFALKWHYDVAGIDYSQNGCRMAEANLLAVGCTGEISWMDFNQLDTEFYGKYDIVFSWGVVEHFEQTADIVGRFATCLAPTGLLITVVPNMAGLMGHLQKLVDAQIYNLHVPLNKEALALAHTANGLRICAAGYLGFLALGMINISTLPFNRWLGKLRAGVDLLHLYGARATRLRPQSAHWSSYVAVIAQHEPGHAGLGHSSNEV